MHQVNPRKILHFAILYTACFALVLLEIRVSNEVSGTSIAQVALFGAILFLLPSVLSNTRAPAVLWALALSLITCLTIGILVYVSLPGVEINEDVVHALIQTNPSEAYEFLSPIPVLLATLLASLIFYLLYRLARNNPRTSPVPLVLVVALYLVTFGTQQPYLWGFVADAVDTYHEEFAEYRRLQAKRAVDEPIEAQKSRTGEAYIVVIGESLNRNHMSLYGYGRRTTPNLDKRLAEGRIIAHPRAISFHTHSQPVLKFALTSANQYNKKEFWKSSSILRALGAAGFHTAWISNQTAYGAWDNLITILAEEADYELRTNKFIGRRVDTSHHDEVLIPYIEDQLAKNDSGNTVIFVHLIGNHTDYCERYPERFKVYSGSEHEYFDCYDNSVFYNDHVVSQIFDLAGHYPRIKGIMYLSDHGDDVLNGLGHDAGRFTHAMTEIPLLFQFSNGYQETYPEKLRELERNISDKPFVNDFLYDTILGMAGVETSLSTPAGDLFSAEYAPRRLQTTGRPVKQAASGYLQALNEEITGHL